MKFQQKYPRVLIVGGEPFSQASATGITISNLFRGWPKDKLAQIYTANIPRDESFCERYWKLSPRDILGAHIVSGLTSRVSGNSQQAGQLSASVRKGSEIQKSRLVSKLRKFASLLDFIPYKLPKSVREEVREFQPDVIYSLLGSIRMVRLVRQISDEHRVPVIPHFMDDWLSTYSMSADVIASRFGRRQLPKLTKKLLTSAYLGFSISEEMSVEYEEKFGIHFLAFMNTVENVYPPRAVREVSCAEPLMLVYIGGAHLGRLENLAAVAAAVQTLSKETENVKFHIYVPGSEQDKVASYFAGYLGTTVKNSVAPADVGSTLFKYDLAVHVESFSPLWANFTRLSISTKIPQYLAAALPVLAVGPRDLASCQYISRQNCGEVVAERDPKVLLSAIGQFIESSKLREQLSNNARTVAEHFHLATKERQRFLHAIGEVVSRGRVKAGGLTGEGPP